MTPHLTYMYYPIIILAIVISGSFIACQGRTDKPLKNTKNKAQIIDKVPAPTVGSDGMLHADTAIFTKQVQNLRRYAAAKGYNTEYAMLIDLGLHSGLKRCFIVQLSSGKTVHAGLVTHGSSPSKLALGQRVYSNVEGSLCSSLGRYKIGAGYQGSFGLAYKLYGLDTSNNHAYARAVVLHSHQCVPDAETQSPICQSWGCPTISPNFLKIVSGYITRATTPLLLHIYDSNQAP